MPYLIKIDTTRRRALVDGKPPNDYVSSIAGMDELAALLASHTDFAILCDFRENDYTPSTAESGKLADAYASRFAGRPMAIVVSGLLHYGIANMITTVIRLRGNPVRAFRNLGDAEKWLDEALALAR